MAATKRKITGSPPSAAVSDAAWWFCAIFLIGLLLLGSVWEDQSLREEEEEFPVTGGRGRNQPVFERQRPCEEIYVVGEGETLNTISEKCGDPFIVERNPHIHDPDDVFPGLVIRITPGSSGS